MYATCRYVHGHMPIAPPAEFLHKLAQAVDRLKILYSMSHMVCECASNHFALLASTWHSAESVFQRHKAWHNVATEQTLAVAMKSAL